MASYRAALIGCGAMGTEHGRGYTAQPNVDLVAIADPNPENLARFGDRFGIPAAARYASYHDLFARESVDIVGIVTPVKVTPGAVLAAVEARPRGIFAEKPIAASLADADAMVEACQRAGIAFACGAIWRSHPFMRVAARLIHQDRLIGRVHTINVLGLESEISGGGCHSLNIVRLLADSEVDWVIGWMAGDPVSNHDQGGGGYLHFVNGVEAFVHQKSGAKRGVEVLGEWGTFFWDWQDVQLWRTASTWESRHTYRDLKPVPFPYPPLTSPEIYPPITHGIQGLIDAIESGGEPLTSGDDMRRVLEIAIAMRESARRGRVPVALPIVDRSLTIIPGAYRWLGANPILESSQDGTGAR